MDRDTLFIIGSIIVIIILIVIFYFIVKSLHKNRGNLIIINNNELESPWQLQTNNNPCKVYRFKGVEVNNNYIAPLPTYNKSIVENIPTLDTLPSCLSSDMIYTKLTNRICQADKCITSDNNIVDKGYTEAIFTSSQCQLTKCRGELSLLSIGYTPDNPFCLNSDLKMSACDPLDDTQLFNIYNDGLYTQIQSYSNGLCLSVSDNDITDNICNIEITGKGLTFIQCPAQLEWYAVPNISNSGDYTNHQQLVNVKNKTVNRTLGLKLLEQLESLQSIYVTDSGDIIMHNRTEENQCITNRSTAQYFSLYNWNKDENKPVCDFTNFDECVRIPN